MSEHHSFLQTLMPVPSLRVATLILNLVAVVWKALGCMPSIKKESPTLSLCMISATPLLLLEFGIGTDLSIFICMQIRYPPETSCVNSFLAVALNRGIIRHAVRRAP